MRKVISLVLLLAFILVCFTGIFMETHKSYGRHPSSINANDPGQRSVNGAVMDRRPASFFPKELHELAGYTMLLVGSIHLVLNFRVLKGYFGLRRRS